MEEQAEVICIECAHHRSLQGGDNCHANAEEERDLITGEMKLVGVSPCFVMRYGGLKKPVGDCGITGKLFKLPTE